MRRAAGVIALCVLAAASASADEARIAMPTALAANVRTGHHGGLDVGLEPRPRGVLVTVSRSVRAWPASPAYPLADPGACGDGAALAVPGSFRLPLELEVLARRPGAALARLAAVVDYVSRAVVLDDGGRGAQDAAAVLARGRGRCSGRANAAVGLLRAMGIPARPVHGLLVGDGGARWHRWGEAWLGPLGWVPFDPGASVGLVSVRYLPLAGSGEGLSTTGVRLERIDERGYLGVPVRAGLRVLPAGGVTLRCAAPPGDAGITAMLVGPDGSRWARRGGREVVFAGMLPGRYHLTWRAGGRPAALSLVLGGAPDVLVELGAEGEADP
jgi:Transglutaminase-like superfamily